MNVSVISFAFHKLVIDEQMDIYGYLDTIKYRLRLDVADIWNRMLVPHPAGDIWARILGSDDWDYVRKVKRALDERELSVVNLAVDGANLWDDDPEVREQNHKNALIHLRAAEMLGAQTLRIDTGQTKGTFEWTNEQFDWIAKLYGEYSQYAKNAGFRVGPENHAGASLMPANVKRLCEAVNSPAFGVLLHFKRWKGDEADQGDDIIAPWAMHTHVGTAIGPDELYAKMTALRNIGYKAGWSVEMVPSRFTELEIWVARVRDVLAQWAAEG